MPATARIIVMVPPTMTRHDTRVLYAAMQRATTDGLALTSSRPRRVNAGNPTAYTGHLARPGTRFVFFPARDRVAA